MFDLSGQIAIVTGGANGIGQGIVESLASAGAKVIVTDIDVEKGEELAKKIDGEFLKLDVTDKENAQAVVDEVVKRHGKIDILASNTGIYPDVRIEDMTEEDSPLIVNSVVSLLSM